MYGQIANVFGRHAALQFSMICMLIGSVLATAAQNYPMLLLGRAFQGVSAAGINNVRFISRTAADVGLPSPLAGQDSACG